MKLLICCSSSEISPVVSTFLYWLITTCQSTQITNIPMLLTSLDISYFNRIPRLWNTLLVINLNCSIDTIKKQLFYLITSLLNLILPIVEHSVSYVCVLDVNLYPDLQTLMTKPLIMYCISEVFIVVVKL